MYFLWAGLAVSTIRGRVGGTWNGLAWTGSRGNRWDVSATGCEIDQEIVDRTREIIPRTEKLSGTIIATRAWA
jgi:hypothetical protein